MDTKHLADYIDNEQENLVDVLTKVHKEFGVKEVKKFLRLALVRYSIEISDLDGPDDELIADIANSLKIPCHQH